MNEVLRRKLITASKIGTNLDTKIANSLIEGLVLSDIKNLALLNNCSLSSITRFINRIGYISFKEFYLEYNNIPNNLKMKSRYEIMGTLPRECDNNSSEVDIRAIAKKIQGKIFIITSRRGKALGKFIMERLNDAHIPNQRYSESQDNIEDFYNQITSDDTLIMFSVSGHSYMTTQMTDLIAQNKETKHPFVIVLSNHKFFKKHHAYKNCSQIMLPGNHPNDTVEDWVRYNVFTKEAFGFVFDILNHYFEINYKNKEED